jgi:hypothetical protein
VLLLVGDRIQLFALRGVFFFGQCGVLLFSCIQPTHIFLASRDLLVHDIKTSNINAHKCFGVCERRKKNPIYEL